MVETLPVRRQPVLGETLPPAALPDCRELTAAATVVHRGRSMAYTRAEVLNQDGKPVAMATATALHR